MANFLFQSITMLDMLVNCSRILLSYYTLFTAQCHSAVFFQMARHLILEAATGHQSFQSRRSRRCIVLVDAPFPVKKILSIAKGFPTLPFFTKCTSPVLLRGCCKLLTRWECQNISTAFFFFPQTYYSKYDFMKAVHLQQSCTQIEKGTVDFLK